MTRVEELLARSAVPRLATLASNDVRKRVSTVRVSLE
jgi:hypothetical protein